MKKTILCASALWLALSSVNGFAAVSGNEKISRLGAQESGVAILYTQDGWGTVANNSCSTGTGVLALNTNTDAGKVMLSIALAAAAANATVVVFTKDSECLAVGGLAPAVSRIDILN